MWAVGATGAEDFNRYFGIGVRFETDFTPTRVNEFYFVGNKEVADPGDGFLVENSFFI
jgi:hypothetical protein